MVNATCEVKRIESLLETRLGSYNKSLKEYLNKKYDTDSNDEDKISFEEIYNELIDKYGNRVQLKTCIKSIDAEKKAVYIPIASGDSISITPISTDMINICVGRTSTVCHCLSSNHTIKEMNRGSLNEIIKLVDSVDGIANIHNNMIGEDNFNLNDLVIEEDSSPIELTVEVLEKENK